MPLKQIEYRNIITIIAMKKQSKETIQRQDLRAAQMEKRYVILWKKGLAPKLITKQIGEEFFLSDSRTREILRPRKLRDRHGLK
jgi:hypothetical protein